MNIGTIVQEDLIHLKCKNVLTRKTTLKILKSVKSNKKLEALHNIKLNPFKSLKKKASEIRTKFKTKRLTPRFTFSSKN